MCSLSLCVGTLFVGNLSFDVDEDLLQEFVTSQGHTLSSVRVITSYDGRCKGYAVCFIHTPFCLNILYSTLGTRLGPILYCVLCTIIFANCNTCACECAYTCTCSISSSQQRPLELSCGNVYFVPPHTHTTVAGLDMLSSVLEVRLRELCHLSMVWS